MTKKKHEARIRLRDASNALSDEVSGDINGITCQRFGQNQSEKAQKFLRNLKDAVPGIRWKRIAMPIVGACSLAGDALPLRFQTLIAGYELERALSAEEVEESRERIAERLNHIRDPA